MSNIQELRQTYVKDVELMASKSRFGFFSIPPSASAAISDSSNNKIKKDENGKIITEQRNIFSGLTSSGTLKKSFFNYESSVFQGDPYMDPGKVQRQKRLEESKKLAQKEPYKPASLSKTPDPKAAYQYIGQKQTSKNAKDYIDENGKVKTQPRNIASSSLPNIQRLKLRQIKHMAEPYEAHIKKRREDLKKQIALRGQVPFRGSSSKNGQFYTYRQTYGWDENCRSPSNQLKKSASSTDMGSHDSKFRPSAFRKYDTFSYPEYMPGGSKSKTQISLTSRTQKSEGKETFRLVAPVTNSKPCPSITCLKANIMRSIR